jgi:hypothetical protein
MKPNETHALLLGLSCCLAAQTARAEKGPVDADFFERKVRPVLAEKCFECHSTESKSLKGNLLLDSREGLLKGGDTGPSVVPGKPEKSLLVSAIHYDDPDTAMPPKKAGGKLPAAVIADIQSWVQAGAPWPEGGPAKKTSQQFDLAARKAEHWCWKSPVLHAAPAVAQDGWPRAVSDRFLLAKLEAAKLRPAPPADRGTLLRRLTFDLTGLPPSESELKSFLEDKSPAAVERVVDRLLASPHFGERWTRHWMDLVRYAESRGHEFDPIIPNAWQYRDYLVRAFNADVPYNAFVKEHIAGDLFPARLNKDTGANESILGTGFWHLGEEVHSPVDIRQDEVDRLDNRLDVMTKSFLGVTVACARCHDHKFDAISQKDYYALSGFLVSSSQRLVRFETIEQERAAAEGLARLRPEAAPVLANAVAAAIRPGLARLPEVLQSARSAFLSDKSAPGAPTENRSADHLAALWKTELKTALESAAHPLHSFARAWLAAEVRPLRASPAVQTAEPQGGPRIIIADYTRPGATPLLQDGFAFGLKVAEAGALIPGTSSESPLAAVVSHTAARRDEAWRNISSKGERDPGTLGQYARSGQTLRTPEVTFTSGSVWYLVRGAGRAYAATNSHIMVQGPLHGRLLTKWQDTGRWEWIKHDLTSYKGHRAHIEIVPEGAGNCEVAMVAESDEKPALPSGYAHAPLESLAAFSGEPAAALQALLTETAAALEKGTLANTPALASLANWVFASTDLLCPPGSPERMQLARTARPLIERHEALAKSFRPESQVATAMFDGTGADEFLLKRGSPKTPLAQVPRRFLEAIAGAEPLNVKGTSGRRELAEMIAAESNPLTSRVIVNRVWHHLFGRGLVPTVDNFGVLGQPPSHPELLDTLAVRFATTQNWSLKALIRELVLSSAYAMSSKPDPAAEEADPQNVLLHRMNLKRLDGESIRDSLLAISGRLDPKLGGPSIPVHVTSFMDGRGRPKSGPLDGDGRRSLYVSIKRNFLSPMMLAFDTPIPFNTMGRRNVSNVPAQSLVMMNDPFVIEQAAHWAKSLPASATPDERIQLMYARALARHPLAEETADAKGFLAEQAQALGVKSDDPKVWADFAHVLLNTKEFIHLN